MNFYESDSDKEAKWLSNLRKEDSSMAIREFLKENDPRRRFQIAKTMQTQIDSKSEYLAKRLHEGEILYKYLQSCKDRDAARYDILFYVLRLC